MRARPFALVPLVAVAVSCGGGGSARVPEAGTLRLTGIGASAEPTIRGARLLPENVDENGGYGSEPGGGVRAITAGLRVVTTREGAVLASDERLPQAPQLTVPLPERLGGGFLFVLGTTVWRADHWLDPARPVFTSPQAIQAILPGLDRVYLRAQNSYLAIDGRTGKVLDLGPWPATPHVSGYAAADGWRAVAITDLRGLVATFDAGATWRALDLPIEPRYVSVSGDSLAIAGIESTRAEAWFELGADGSIARMSAAPRDAKGKVLMPPAPVRPAHAGPMPGPFPGSITVPMPSLTPPVPAPPATTRGASSPKEDVRDEAAPDAASRVFGKRPLAAAIEDGWPLTDGTAVVARDGALARVRLSDGALVDVAPNAFPLKPARCHAVSLTRRNALGAFGFVCGEPRGTTVVYAYDPMQARMTELRRFDRPRVVTSSGNGALAVRGPCAEDGDSSSPPREPTRLELPKSDAGAGATTLAPSPPADAARPPSIHPYCVLGHDNAWREVHIRGDVGAERVIVLADGKIAVVSPPQGENGVARLTLLENGRATTLPVAFPKVAADVARVLRLGVWLDGFEERRPGVVGGWVEAGGVMLGIEIASDGTAKIGQLIRDAGMPFVSGRYGLGWTASRRGFETTDGGMTWSNIELPEPLVPLGKVERRACGPIGCLAAGWLRVGWGEAKKAAPAAIPPPHRAPVAVSTPQLSLACEPENAAMPTPATSHVRATPPSTPATLSPSSSRRVTLAGGGPPVLTMPLGVSDLPPFYAQPGPTLRESERGMPFEVQELLEKYVRLGPLARIYAWGPKTGDWDTQGKWIVRWLSPFSGWSDARVSLPALPPAMLLDFTKTGSYFGYGGISAYSGYFQLAPGDDAAHAMVFLRRVSRSDVVPFDLEADRAPVEIRRADGEPFVEVESATRASGRWFLATPPAPGVPSPVTTIWQVDGSVARELVRVSRTPLDTGRPNTTRLARRSDGRAIGLVVDGQATAERATPTRWVLPIDLESGQLGEPESLGYADLAGRTLEACSDDVVGWVMDASIASSSVRVQLPRGNGSIHSAHARLRITPSRACIERVAGMFDGQASDRAVLLTRATGRASTAPRAGEIVATAFSAQARFALRCTIAK